MKLRSALTLLCICICGHAIGQAPGAQKPQPVKRDPMVESLFNQMKLAYRNLNTLHEKITFKFDVNVPGMIEDVLPVELELKIKQPNKLSLNYVLKNATGKLMKYQMVSDGENIYTYSADLNAYEKFDLKKTGIRIPSVLNTPDFDVLFRAIDPFQNLRIPSEKLKVGSPTKINDVDVDVATGLLDQGSQLSATFLLAFGQKDHLVRGMSFKGGGEQNGKQIRFQFDANYDVVEPNAKVEDADFKFVAPQGAKFIEPKVKN